MIYYNFLLCTLEYFLPYLTLCNYYYFKYLVMKNILLILNLIILTIKGMEKDYHDDHIEE